MKIEIKMIIKKIIKMIIIKVRVIIIHNSKIINITLINLIQTKIKINMDKHINFSNIKDLVKYFNQCIDGLIFS
jgi:hypothetical protein